MQGSYLQKEAFGQDHLWSSTQFLENAFTSIGIFRKERKEYAPWGEARLPLSLERLTCPRVLSIHRAAAVSLFTMGINHGDSCPPPAGEDRSRLSCWGAEISESCLEGLWSLRSKDSTWQKSRLCAEGRGRRGRRAVGKLIHLLVANFFKSLITKLRYSYKDLDNFESMQTKK